MSQPWKPGAVRPQPAPAPTPGQWQRATPSAPPVRPGGHRQDAPDTPQLAHTRDAYHMTVADMRAYMVRRNPAREGLKKLADRDNLAVYRLEKLDPKHRFGDMLMMLLLHWDPGDNVPHAPSATSPYFFRWLDTLSPLDVERIGNDAFFAQLWVESPGVTYATNRVRERFRVHVNGGRVQVRGRQETLELLTTTAAQTAMGTDGSYLWVLDRWNGLYTDESKVGETHHSTFARGRAIRGAGEWRVEAGRVQLITGKTGHYRVPVEQFVDALRLMRDHLHIDLHGAAVAVYRNDGATSYLHRVPVNAYLGVGQLQQRFALFPGSDRVVDAPQPMRSHSYGLDLGALTV